jgi:capsular exopolysaccharide synthesis family protein
VKSSIDIKIESEHTFDIIYLGARPEETMNVANRLAASFVTNATAQRAQQAKDTTAVIDTELEALKQRLDAQSQRIHAYRQGNVRELPDHVDDNIRMEDRLRDRHRELETKITEDEARRAAVLKEMKELEAKGALDQTVIEEKSPAQLRLEELRIKQKELMALLKPRHPDLLQIQSEIQHLERTVASQPDPRSTLSEKYIRYLALKSELETLEQRVNGYRKEQYALANQEATYRQRVASTPQHERALEDMQREYEVGQKQFHALLDKRLDSNLAQGLEQSGSRIAFAVIEPAGLPSAPFSPRRERLVLLGIFTGLGVGLVLAFFREQHDTTFRNVDDFQSFTTLPAVGIIPTFEGRSGLVLAADTESVAAEQYRVFAMRVQQLCAAQNARVLLITSAAGGEGKSVTALNLASALSSIADGRVLVVDADMRKPKLHHYLSLNASADKSFSALLQNSGDDPRNYIVKTRNVDAILGSNSPGDPVAALASPKARTAIDRLKDDYRYVIIDAPPTLPIADSHILSGLSDKVIFVVRARKTPRELFQHAVETFEATNILGAVLNDVDYQGSRYAYAYEYYKEKARK